MTQELLQGLTRFKSEYFPRHREQFHRLVSEGQKPPTLFIGCADSRVVPDLFTGAPPGGMFVVRNVGNMVPPADQKGGLHGVAAAIEYAVDILEVEEIIVCGHSHCGAIRALYEPPSGVSRNLLDWLELAGEARIEGEEVGPDMLRRTERRAILLQLDRLMDFPSVRRRVEAGEMTLQGWHYTIEDGEVLIFDPEAGQFRPHEESRDDADVPGSA